VAPEIAAAGLMSHNAGVAPIGAKAQPYRSGATELMAGHRMPRINRRGPELPDDFGKRGVFPSHASEPPQPETRATL
jgi:hypothetical protein